MKSVSQHLFALAPQAQIPRSKFVQPSSYKTAFNAGYLIPFYVDEALPGDTFVGRFTAFARMTTLVVPFLDNLYLDFHFFAVPNRILWTHWKALMGEHHGPTSSTDYLVPVINSGLEGVPVGSIYDYMGIPPGVPNLEFSALFFRAYRMIWSEWFRDKNLQDYDYVPDGDGPDPLDYQLLPRGKRKDYFTACLPWPQRGDGVSIPLGDTAPVVSNGDTIYFNRRHTGDVQPDAVMRWTDTSGTTAQIYGDPVDTHWEDKGVIFGQQTGLYADLGDASAATINSLRQAFQLQRLLERDARGGSGLYQEILYSHFGVTNPDARMQRPEYLGGGTIPIYSHAVAQTSASDSTTPQGNLAAFATAGGNVGFSKSFTEHCIVMGLVSVRADLTYQQGLHRMFSRRSRFDFYWPALSNLGEQAVLNKEIYAQGAGVLDHLTRQVVDDMVFGYQERWAEYRYGVSKITGKLRSQVDGSLDVWHLAQHFTNLPKLNSSFIQDKPPVSRVLAVQDEPQFLFDSNAMITKVRPMPLYSVPGLIDHF